MQPASHVDRGRHAETLAAAFLALRGYEILDYDLDGALRRRIRKEYRPTRLMPNTSITSAISPYFNRMSETRVSFVICMTYFSYIP